MALIIACRVSLFLGLTGLLKNSLFVGYLMPGTGT